MPIYEYECSECGLHFDRFQRFGDQQPGTCPNGHKQVHRILSRPAIIFKGSGFYSTDYGHNGRSGPARKAPKQKGSEPAAGSKSEGESE
jgi:putative FmdB family regulatory protein